MEEMAARAIHVAATFVAFVGCRVITLLVTRPLCAVSSNARPAEEVAIKAVIAYLGPDLRRKVLQASEGADDAELTMKHLIMPLR